MPNAQQPFQVLCQATGLVFKRSVVKLQGACQKGMVMSQGMSVGGIIKVTHLKCACANIPMF